MSAAAYTARQHFHAENEAEINKQINLELYASYVFLSMAAYCDRDDVALPGFHKFFMQLSKDERTDAEKLMKYQDTRGGRVVFKDIQKPMHDDWGSPLDVMQAALELSKNVNSALKLLHDTAGKHHDGEMSSFVEEHYLTQQVEYVKKISDHLTNMKRGGKGLGEYMFDKHSLQD